MACVLEKMARGLSCYVVVIIIFYLFFLGVPGFTNWLGFYFGLKLQWAFFPTRKE